MQKTFIGILLTTTLALAVLCLVQSRQLRAAHERIRLADEAQRVEAEAREAQTAKSRELERTAQRLEKQVGEFTTVTATLRASEAAQASNLTTLAQQIRPSAEQATPAGDKPGVFGKEMGDMLEKMMKDPSMREMMRSQQKAAINMMYGGLFKEINLSPEEKEKLTGILTETQMKSVENAKGLFGGTKEGEPPEDATKLLADAKKQSDAEIKALLGDERYAQFTEYQKNIGERMQLDQLKTRLEGENLALQDAQSAQLLQAMKEEKAAVPAPIPSDATQSPADVKSLMTSENIDKQLQWMDDYNRRVLDRAAQFLTPEQLKSYREMQEQQASMQQMGLKMAREMFGARKGASPAPAK
jgi:hypothetical protein